MTAPAVRPRAAPPAPAHLDCEAAARRGGTYTVRRGARAVIATPRAAMVRAVVARHVVDARAPLGVYPRPLDLAVPRVCGSPADEGEV
jgi:hypothetical protein